MTITLKSTIVFSATLAGLLNLWQFAASYQQREDALAPGYALAATSEASPSPAPLHAKLAVATPAPQTPVVVATPAPAPPPSLSPDAVQVSQDLAAAGLKTQFASLYLDVQAKTRTPWQLLAAVHEVETGQSGSTSRASYAGAVGPMQFMPATFYHYAQASDGDGSRNITDVTDAMYTAGRYLAAGGAASGDYSQALFYYNHSSAYVSKVLGIADRLGL